MVTLQEVQAARAKAQNEIDAILENYKTMLNDTGIQIQKVDVVKLYKNEIEGGKFCTCIIHPKQPYSFFKVLMFYANLIGSKVLITTNAWLYAPDGRPYRAIHGTLKSVDEVKDVFGFVPSRSHANWMLQIGDCVVMGCQVMYLIQADEVNTWDVGAWESDATNGITKFDRPSAIYVTT